MKIVLVLVLAIGTTVLLGFLYLHAGEDVLLDSSLAAPEQAEQGSLVSPDVGESVRSPVNKVSSDSHTTADLPLKPDALSTIYATEVAGDDPESQTTRQGILVNGKKEGAWRELRPDGSIWTDAHYKDGKLNGGVVTWDSEARKQSEDVFKDGLLHGESVGWHQTGEMAYKYTFAVGKRNGPWMEWYKDGAIKGSGTSLNRELHGACNFYGPDSRLDEKRSGEYSNGVKVADSK